MMNKKWFGVSLAAAVMVATPVTFANAQTLVAQNTYGGSAVASQDSILSPPPDAFELEAARHAEVLAAETNLNLSGSYLHTQYHENLSPGDDENGSTGGFGVGASALLPHLLVFPNVDLYTALMYNFSAGNITYGGHYLFSGLPVQATDRAVFNRIEARFGLGFPLIGGAEVIPFITGGYQAWNRNIDLKGQIGTDELYSTGLVGAGLRFDAPITPALVLSATAEGMALFAGNISLNNVNINHGLGGSAEESFDVGGDYAARGPLHFFAKLNWTHFNYAGNKPTDSTYFPPCGCEYFEPLSTTTQFGANVGVAYSF
jgi:hypothetical protein